MSRHLLIRCDRVGCSEQTETHASDTTPTSIAVPGGWLTLREEGLPDKHYCSKACLAQSYAPLAQFVAQFDGAPNAAPYTDTVTINTPQPEVSLPKRKKAQ